MRSFCVFIFLISFTVKSQTNTTQYTPVVWDSIKHISIPADSSLKNYGLIILDDRTIIRDLDAGELNVFTKTPSIPKNFGNTKTYTNSVEQQGLSITKLMQIKIQDKSGIDHLKNLFFPETFDPLIAFAEVPNAEREKIHFPFYPQYEITAFDARKILPKNRVQPIAWKSYETEEEFSGTGFKKKNIKFRFELEGLKPGDEIQIIYKVEMPSRAFYGATSDRIFFNGTFPKQKCKFEFISVRGGIIVNYTEVNSAEKFLTKEILKAGSQYFCWELKNVMPVDAGRYFRPAEELPYVHQYISLTKDPLGKGNKNWSANVIQSLKNFNHLEGMSSDYTDKNTMSINKFFAERKKATLDSSSVAIMNSIHNYFITNCDYLTEEKRKLEDDYRLRPGELIQKGILFEGDRAYIYNELLRRLKSTYYMSAISDKRFNHFDTVNLTPFEVFAPAFAMVTKNKEIIYYIPKNSKDGYFANELPFYYEGSYSLVIPHKINEGEKAEVLFVKTPESTEADNVRQTSLEMKIDSVNYAVSCFGKLNLSGQFSTLTRNVYRGSEIDFTINPNYKKKLFPAGKAITNKKEKLSSLSEVFPFRANFEVGFDCKNMITKKSETEFELDLSGMINHVMWENLSLKDTTYRFYNDFRFTDVFRIKIVLPSNLKCTNAASLAAKVKNDYGKYEFKIIELGPNELLLESSFISGREKMKGSENKLVEEIFNQVKKSVNPILILKK